VQNITFGVQKIWKLFCQQITIQCISDYEKDSELCCISSPWTLWARCISTAFHPQSRSSSSQWFGILYGFFLEIYLVSSFRILQSHNQCLKYCLSDVSFYTRSGLEIANKSHRKSNLDSFQSCDVSSPSISGLKMHLNSDLLSFYVVLVLILAIFLCQIL
jgi:hypothetical protein